MSKLRLFFVTNKNDTFGSIASPKSRLGSDLENLKLIGFNKRNREQFFAGSLMNDYRQAGIVIATRFLELLDDTLRVAVRVGSLPNPAAQLTGRRGRYWPRNGRESGRLSCPLAGG